jgi:hypothetical protein
MNPLYELLKEDAFKAPDKWNNEQNNAFSEIKEKLKTAPVLAAPRLNEPFIIETDASLRGIAATLLQKDLSNKRNEHPIAYASRTLKPHQRRYHINELELFAVVYGLREFRPYIEGNGVTVVRSDNKVICAKFFKYKPPLTGRMAKLMLEIQPFDITF